MRFSAKAIYLTLILLATQVCSETEWRQFEIKPFKINYTKSEQLYAEELSSILQTAYRDLAPKFNFQLTNTIHVFLAPSDEIFGDLTGKILPHWGEGVADPAHGLIILKSPSLSANFGRFPTLVRHELIHILFGKSLTHPSAIPRWFNEGIAIYLSGDREFSNGSAISRALLTDSILALDEIDDVLKFHTAKARLAYEESFSFTNFLRNEFGEEALLRFTTMLQTSTSLSGTFMQTFGKDLFDMELEWNEYIEKKYRWRFLLDFDTLLWLAIPFLFILTYTMIKIRNRKKLKEWERQERREGM